MLLVSCRLPFWSSYLVPLPLKGIFNAALIFEVNQLYCADLANLFCCCCMFLFFTNTTTCVDDWYETFAHVEYSSAAKHSHCTWWRQYRTQVAPASSPKGQGCACVLFLWLYTLSTLVCVFISLICLISSLECVIEIQWASLIPTVPVGIIRNYFTVTHSLTPLKIATVMDAICYVTIVSLQFVPKNVSKSSLHDGVPLPWQPEYAAVTYLL